MSKQIQDAYIVAATRTPIGRSGRGYFRNTRPDDLLVAAIQSALKQAPGLDPAAIEAQRMGYLKATDRIVFNGNELLYQAVREAKAMHDAGWRPPRRAAFRVAGRAGLATITAQLVNMRDGGFISAHDYHCARTIADIVCGGDVEAGSVVDEAWVMALERKGFTALLSHPKTQERLMSMVQTGKPVRN